MAVDELEAPLRYVAFPPLKLALRDGYLRIPRLDFTASDVVAKEPAAVEGPCLVGPLGRVELSAFRKEVTC